MNLGRANQNGFASRRKKERRGEYPSPFMNETPVSHLHPLSVGNVEDKQGSNSKNHCGKKKKVSLSTGKKLKVQGDQGRMKVIYGGGGVLFPLEAWKGFSVGARRQSLRKA